MSFIKRYIKLITSLRFSTVSLRLNSKSNQNKVKTIPISLNKFVQNIRF